MSDGDQERRDPDLHAIFGIDAEPPRVNAPPVIEVERMSHADADHTPTPDGGVRQEVTVEQDPGTQGELEPRVEPEVQIEVERRPEPEVQIEVEPRVSEPQSRGGE